MELELRTKAVPVEALTCAQRLLQKGSDITLWIEEMNTSA